MDPSGSSASRSGASSSARENGLGSASTSNGSNILNPGLLGPVVGSLHVRDPGSETSGKNGREGVVGFSGSDRILQPGTSVFSSTASAPHEGLFSGLFTTLSGPIRGHETQGFRNTVEPSEGKQGMPVTTTTHSNLFSTPTTPTLTSSEQPTRDEDQEEGGINLECSETGSNLDDEDGNMETGSVCRVREGAGSDAEDEGSSCTMNGSQCSEPPGGGAPSPGEGLGSTALPGAPRRTKNGILLRDRTNRLPVADRVRQKRSAMQDMARPLKHWLYRHRGNPYPSKAEKLQLGRLSNMSLIQVSNWFANARRRLKNTVRGADMSWDTRIQRYNTCVQGNAELLSASSSSDSGAESDTEASVQKQEPDQPPTPTPAAPIAMPPLPPPPSDSQPQPGADGDVTKAAPADPGVSPRGGLASPVQHKFKQHILHRYLNDSFEHSLQFRSPFENRSRNPSGSVGSHDFEDCSMSMSSRSSPIHEHSFDDVPEDLEQFARQFESQPKKPEDELYWKEISAALALTTLARSSRYSYK